jgi:signal transduction histidine kinase
MKAPSSGQDGAISGEQIAHFRHELLTPLNHILGLTEIQMEEAANTGIQDYVPALAEINAGGRGLLGIIEKELVPLSRSSDLERLSIRLQSEAGRTLAQTRKLAEQVRAISPDAAADVDLVSSAVEKLISISREIA